MEKEIIKIKVNTRKNTLSINGLKSVTKALYGRLDDFEQFEDARYTELKGLIAEKETDLTWCMVWVLVAALLGFCIGGVIV